MRRLLVCLAGFCVLSLAGLSAHDRKDAGTHDQAPAAAPAPAADTWMPTEVKNLTVLPKTTSPADVMKIMKSWSEALNMQCVGCHVGQPDKPLSTFDFAADTRPRKETSRVMLRGMIAMNAEFKKIEDDTPQVQCSTCHKRSRHVEDDLPAKPPTDEHHQ